MPDNYQIDYKVGGHTDEMIMHKLQLQAKESEREFKKRIQEIKDLSALGTNDPARDQKIEIEKSIAEDPYTEHLYTEREFEHLMFLELRAINKKFDVLLEIMEAQFNEQPYKGAFRDRVQDYTLYDDPRIPVPSGECGEIPAYEKELPPENKDVDPSIFKIDPKVDALLKVKADEIKRGRPKKLK